MYFAAKWQDKAKSKKPLLVAALLVAAVGTLAAAIATPVLALVFLAIAAMGFKSASPLFWTIPQSGLHPLVLAPAIAIINSLGNLGGFVAPFGFGIIKETTGSVVPGLFALAAASTLAAGLVYFLKERRSPATPEDASEQEPGGCRRRSPEAGHSPLETSPTGSPRLTQPPNPSFPAPWSNPPGIAGEKAARRGKAVAQLPPRHKRAPVLRPGLYHLRARGGI